MTTINIRFGEMHLLNFGPFIGVHTFDWDRGPALWFIAGRNLAEPELGANGAGKTTLVTALYWALTGRTLRSARPGDRVEPWHGKGATKVQLHFVRGNTPHTLIRQRHPNALLLDNNPTTDTDIVKLLGYDPEILLYTSIFGQHNALFMDLRPEAQSALFTDLLHLDVYLQASERAGKALRRYETEIAEYERTKASLEGARDALAEAETEATALAKQYDAERAGKLEALETTISMLETQYQNLEQALENIPAPETVQSALEKDRTDALNNQRQWAQIATTALNLIQTAKREIRKLEQQLDSAVDAGVCPACGQALSTNDKQKLSRHIEDELKKQRAVVEKETETNEDAIAEALAWGDTADKIKGQLDKERQAEREIVAQRTRLESDMEHTAANWEASKKQYQELKDAENPHASALRTLQARWTTNTTALQECAEDLEAARADADLAQLWQDGYKAIRLSIIEEALSEVSLAANRHAERLGLSGWQLEFATERETKKGTTALGFTVMLYPPDVDTPIPWDVYSGGEGQRWQLAVSFGLGEVLLARAGVVPNVEIADEPTRGLSAEGISDLLDCLADRARETRRTVWIIDHHSIDRGAFDGTVLVEKTREQGSMILNA